VHRVLPIWISSCLLRAATRLAVASYAVLWPLARRKWYRYHNEMRKSLMDVLLEEEFRDYIQLVK